MSPKYAISPEVAENKRTKDSKRDGPQAPKTAIQSVRLEELAWKAAQLRAVMEGTSRQAVMSQLLYAWAGPEYVALAARLLAGSQGGPKDDVDAAAALVGSNARV